jgi:hypothetical protein
MTLTQAPLWEKIKTFELDEPDSSLSFSDRLARENGWELEYALGAIEEYKRFMYLICATGEPCTPSDQVDQVWHLHLIYTRSYWHDWCRDTLGRDIHHGPTRGGQKEGEKFTDWYARTLAHYEREFGTAPPPAFWPTGKERFSDIHFVRANQRTHWIIPKIWKRKKT